VSGKENPKKNPRASKKEKIIIFLETSRQIGRATVYFVFSEERCEGNCEE
jgi:hypothetical protein